LRRAALRRRPRRGLPRGAGELSRRVRRHLLSHACAHLWAEPRHRRPGVKEPSKTHDPSVRCADTSPTSLGRWAVSGVLIGVDTGGTFTDVTLYDPATSRLIVAKTPSTPHDPSEGFSNGLGAALAEAGLAGPSVGRVLHGTTVATNLILERKGPAAALIVSTGFRYVLEIGRHDIPRRANLFTWQKPPRPVPPEHIWEAAGRIAPDGREVEPLDEIELRAIARAIKSEGIATVAVVLLHA